jgi:hypothetical protein
VDNTSASCSGSPGFAIWLEVKYWSGTLNQATTAFFHVVPLSKCTLSLQAVWPVRFKETPSHKLKKKRLCDFIRDEGAILLRRSYKPESAKPALLEFESGTFRKRDTLLLCRSDRNVFKIHEKTVQELRVLFLERFFLSVRLSSVHFTDSKWSRDLWKKSLQLRSIHLLVLCCIIILVCLKALAHTITCMCLSFCLYIQQTSLVAPFQ